MPTERQNEIDHNYDFFQRNLARFLENHRGKFALLRRSHVIAFFDGPGEAYRAGLAQFDDEIFSVQEVDDRPAEMGLSSLAFD
jgi:hypothetical protein